MHCEIAENSSMSDIWRPGEYEFPTLWGDFNLVLDVLKDKKGGKPTTHQNSLKMVQNFQNNLDLMHPVIMVY